MRVPAHLRSKLVSDLPDTIVFALLSNKIVSVDMVLCLAGMFALAWFARLPGVSPPSSTQQIYTTMCRFLFVLPISLISLGHHYVFGTRFLLRVVVSIAWGLGQSFFHSTYPLANMIIVQASILRDPGDGLWVILVPLAAAHFMFHRYTMKM